MLHKLKRVQFVQFFRAIFSTANSVSGIYQSEMANHLWRLVYFLESEWVKGSYVGQLHARETLFSRIARSCKCCMQHLHERATRACNTCTILQHLHATLARSCNTCMQHLHDQAILLDQQKSIDQHKKNCLLNKKNCKCDMAFSVLVQYKTQFGTGQ